MSVQDENIPPVPQLVAPLKEGAAGPGVKGYRFDNAWMQWFTQVREKVNVLNASIVNLAGVLGNGLLSKNGSSWNLRTIQGTLGRIVVTNGNGVGGDPTIDLSPIVSNIGATFDGGSSAITAGSQCDVYVPFNCTIGRVTILADALGSITIDVWSDAYGAYPPTDADSITGTSVPAISGSNKYTDSILTGWVTTISTGTTIRFNVDSAATIKRAIIQLEVLRT